MSVKKYRKKPVEVEAMQWDGTAMHAGLIIEWVLNHGGAVNYWCDIPCPGTEEGHYLRIRTLEGDMNASKDDFIIKGVQGDFYPCRADIFAETYEEVIND